MKKKTEPKLVCGSCGSKTAKAGHLCDPKLTTRKAKLYICQSCGLITTEACLLCQPRILKLK